MVKLPSSFFRYLKATDAHGYLATAMVRDLVENTKSFLLTDRSVRKHMRYIQNIE